MEISSLTLLIQYILNISIADIIPGIGNLPLIGAIAKIPIFVLLVLSTAIYFYSFLRIKPFKIIKQHFKNNNKKERYKFIGNTRSYIVQSILKINVIAIFIITTILIAFGPGAIFWIWVFTLITCIITFVENFLSQTYRYYDEEGNTKGGIHHYINVIWKNKAGTKIGQLIMWSFLILIPVQLILLTNQVIPVISTFQVTNQFWPAIIVLLIFIVLIIFHKRNNMIISIISITTFILIIVTGTIYLASSSNFVTFLENILVNAFTLTAFTTGSLSFIILAICTSFFQVDLAGKGYNSIIAGKVQNSDPRTQGGIGMLSNITGNIILLTFLVAPMIVNYNGLAGYGSISSSVNEINTSINSFYIYIFQFVSVIALIVGLVLNWFINYQYSHEIIEYAGNPIISRKIFNVLFIFALIGGFYMINHQSYYVLLLEIGIAILIFVSIANMVTMIKERKNIINTNKKLLQRKK